MRFIDSNIFLRHLTLDVPAMAAECTALLRDIEQGSVQAWTNDLVVAEVVFVLESAGRSRYQPYAHSYSGHILTAGVVAGARRAEQTVLPTNLRSLHHIQHRFY